MHCKTQERNSTVHSTALHIITFFKKRNIFFRAFHLKNIFSFLCLEWNPSRFNFKFFINFLFSLSRCSGRSKCKVDLFRNKLRDQDLTRVCNKWPDGRIIVKYLCYDTTASKLYKSVLQDSHFIDRAFIYFHSILYCCLTCIKQMVSIYLIKFHPFLLAYYEIQLITSTTKNLFSLI